MSKYIYFFGNGKAEGQSSMRALLGGKGANLADMASIGLPVPPGFTITTEACAKFYEIGERRCTSCSATSLMPPSRGSRRPPARPSARRQSAAGLGTLGCRGLDARHDGYRPQSGPQRPRPSRR
jgi:phosphoenolpyruvate synthase/pyruvate phosphate dikinase